MVTWNMRQGSTYGFAVPVGSYRFVAAQANTVTLSTTNTNGKVVADSVGFVKIEDNVAKYRRHNQYPDAHASENPSEDRLDPGDRREGDPHD